MPTKTRDHDDDTDDSIQVVEDGGVTRITMPRNPRDVPAGNGRFTRIPEGKSEGQSAKPEQRKTSPRSETSTAKTRAETRASQKERTKNARAKQAMRTKSTQPKSTRTKSAPAKSTRTKSAPAQSKQRRNSKSGQFAGAPLWKRALVFIKPKVVSAAGAIKSGVIRAVRYLAPIIATASISTAKFIGRTSLQILGKLAPTKRSKFWLGTTAATAIFAGQQHLSNDKVEASPTMASVLNAESVDSCLRTLPNGASIETASSYHPQTGKLESAVRTKGLDSSTSEVSAEVSSTFTDPETGNELKIDPPGSLKLKNGEGISRTAKEVQPDLDPDNFTVHVVVKSGDATIANCAARPGLGRDI